MKKKWTDENLVLAVSKSYSVRQTLIELGLAPIGGNYKTINNAINRLQLDTAHFKSVGWNIKDLVKINQRRVNPLSNILVENSPYTGVSYLKIRILKEGLKHAICEVCGGTEWMNKPIPLELDHINGINNDHRIENLRLLCPNCHAQTATYRGKNIKPV